MRTFGHLRTFGAPENRHLNVRFPDYLQHRPTTMPRGLYVDPEYALETLRPGHGGMALRCCLDRIPARQPGAAARRHLGRRKSEGFAKLTVAATLDRVRRVPGVKWK